MNVRRMYRQIARKNGMTVKEVRDGMKEAICFAGGEILRKRGKCSH